MTTESRVIGICESHWAAHSGNCSGFVKAVALDLGVLLSGSANDIVDQMERIPWSRASSGTDAAHKAAENTLVIAGLKHSPNGHVTVVVPGEIANGKYPTAYWGRLGGVGHKETTINYSWGASERDLVIYRYVRV